MRWKTGDKLRLSSSRIFNEGIKHLTHGRIYDVITFTETVGGHASEILIKDGFDDVFTVKALDFRFLERIEEDNRDEFYENRYIGSRSEDYEMSNTELGEPSADCNCEQLAEIREELTDIKSMIGRLLRNGGDCE